MNVDYDILIEEVGENSLKDCNLPLIEPEVAAIFTLFNQNKNKSWN